MSTPSREEASIASRNSEDCRTTTFAFTGETGQDQRKRYRRAFLATTATVLARKSGVNT